MNPFGGEPAPQQSRPAATALPRLHRAEEGDERAFQLRRWSGTFVDPDLEEQFDQRRAPDLHQRTRSLAALTAGLLVFMATEELLSADVHTSKPLLLAVHLVMVSPLVVYAVSGRIRRDQVNQLPFDFRTTAAVQAWIYCWFVVHSTLHKGPDDTHLATFCVSLLVVHLIVPNRLKLIAPVTALAAVGFAAYQVTAGDAGLSRDLNAVVAIAVSWACGAAFHRELEVSSREQFMIMSRSERYGERLEVAVSRARDLEDELRRQANVDPLTGIGNRRWYFTQLDAEFARCRRRSRPLALVILDVDHFKQINDHHGHPVGDAVLKHLTRIVISSLRTTDRLARIGGEEFAVVMPETQMRDAHDVAERVRAAVAANPVLVSTGAIRMTVSIGVTMCHPDREEPTQAMARADHALYEAKRGGRDLVIAH